MLNVLADCEVDFAAGVVSHDTPVRIGIGNNIRAAAEVMDAFHKAVRDLQDAGFDTCETAVPFGDPTQASMATIEADRARIGTEAFSDVDVILLPTLDSTVPTVAAASANPEQGVSAETTALRITTACRPPVCRAGSTATACRSACRLSAGPVTNARF
jgi:hypothetical protein